jgi:uncharacterized membrane protein
LALPQNREDDSVGVPLLKGVAAGAGSAEEVAGRDPALDRVVGTVLRVGSTVAVVLILGGVLLMLWAALFQSRPLPSVPRPGYTEPARGLDALLAASRGDPSAIISMGLMVLIATPVLRVASTVVYFLLKRDWTYLAVTGFVLLVLVVGLLMGAGE